MMSYMVQCLKLNICVCLNVYVMCITKDIKGISLLVAKVLSWIILMTKNGGEVYDLESKVFSILRDVVSCEENFPYITND